MPKKIAVLIPCYNESLTVEKVISDFRKELPEATIYVYDNNSSDNTAEIAEKAGAIVVHEYRQGKGNVIRSMFRDIDADCYIMADGDGSHPSKHAREMCDLILQEKADMVIGNRLSSEYFQRETRAFHGFGNSLVRGCINMFWTNGTKKEKVMDVMTGYRAFSPIFAKSFPVLSEGFEIETEMTIHALDKNFLIKNIPVGFVERPEESVSTLNTYRDGIKVMLTIFNLYKVYRPLSFFGWLAFFLFLIAVILFIPVFAEYLRTSLVPRFPTLITSGILGLSAFLSLVCGLVLDTSAKNARKNFEVQLNIIKMLLNRK